MGPATYWSPARTCRDSPSVVAPTVARRFLENKIKMFVGWRYLPLRAEDRAVPRGNGRRHPARLAATMQIVSLAARPPPNSCTDR